MSTANEKATLRQDMRTALSQLADSDKQHSSEQICQQICSFLDSHPEIKTVGTFAGLPNEPDLRALHERPGIILAYPLTRDGIMTFHAVANYDDLLVGHFGISEPTVDHPFIDCPDLILCPGFAFTKDGQRLGKGGGFYDRFLEKKSTRTLGIAFPCQVISHIPTESHDRPVEQVLCGPLTPEA